MESDSILPTSLKLTAHLLPENGWLEYAFPFGMAYFQGLQGVQKFSEFSDGC